MHIEQVRARVLEHLSSQKTLTEAWGDSIIAGFDKAASFLDKRLGKLADIPFIGDMAKMANRNLLTKVTVGFLDNLGLGGISEKLKSSGDLVLDENVKQTKSLEQIARNTSALRLGSAGGSIAGMGSGSGSLAGLASSVLGGGFGGAFNGVSGSGGNSGGGLNLLSANPNAFNQFGGASIGRNGQTILGSGGNSIFGNLKNIFSTKEGGIFAPKANLLNGGKTSALGGTMGGIGSIAAMLGGAIGGKFGNVLSMAGTGMQIGSMFGPWGAAIGAGVGALVGLFTGGTKKQDEKARTTAYVNAIADLDKIRIQLQKRPPSINWETGLNNAKQIQADYYEQVNQLKDKKTRNIALKTGREAIDPRFRQVEIEAAAARVYEYNRGETSKNFVGEFAGGVYMDKAFRSQYEGFKRHNGMMPGAYTGKDYIRALIGDGEIVANKFQQDRMRRAAGFDVIAHAGLPNYQPKAEMQKFAGGVSFAAPVVSSYAPVNSAPTIIFNTTIEAGATVTKQDVEEAFHNVIDSPEGSTKIRKLSIKATTDYVNSSGRKTW